MKSAPSAWCAAHTVKKYGKCLAAEKASPGSSHREKRNTRGSDVHTANRLCRHEGRTRGGGYEPESRLAEWHPPNAGFEGSNLQLGGGVLVKGTSYSFPPAPPDNSLLNAPV